MRLKHNSTGTNDFSSLASGVARRADLIKPAMRNRQRIRLRQRALTSSSSGPINIGDEPLHPLPVEQATWRGKRLAGQQIDLERACAALPRGPDQERQGNEKASSDEAGGCVQRGP